MILLNSKDKHLLYLITGWLHCSSSLLKQILLFRFLKALCCSVIVDIIMILNKITVEKIKQQPIVKQLQPSGL
jgi:hypothetical protein